MNPKNTVEKWLLAAGKPFGIEQAHDYRWADAETVQQESYCEYRMIRSIPKQATPQTNNAVNADNQYTVDWSSWQEWTTTLQIDLKRSQDGMRELAAMCVAAQAYQPILSMLQNGGVAFTKAVEIINLTDETNGDLYERYHHRLICEFTEHVQYTLKEINGVVEEIRITLGLLD